MLKKIITLIILLIVAGLIFSFFDKEGSSVGKNVDMLSNGEEIALTKEDVEYFPGANGYFVRPATEAVYPGVVMIHENRGLRPEIRTMAEELAKEGYMVLAVDLLGPYVENQEQARALTANFSQVTGTANMRAAVAYLESQGVPKIASIGWCFGGAQSLQLALSGEEMDATIIYYGRLATTTSSLSPIQWPVLGIFAGADQSISTTSVMQFESALDSLNIPNEVYIYPGVGHAFANPSGANYAPNETMDAWEKTVDFLQRNLKN